MARPKGSKNKEKIDKKSEAVEIHNDVISEGVPAANTKKAKAATSYDEMWTPKPDMGEIVPPADANLICECGHKKEKHYGSEKNWCNESNCRCSAWNQN